ncbi:MAG: hypothetical protein ACRBK7_15030 [Acidimicrobiales bacterium]
MQTTATSSSDPGKAPGADGTPLSFMLGPIDPFKLIVVGILAVLALFVWSIGRNQVVRPMDNLLTERLCLDHAEEIGRVSTGYERSNRFGLVDRSEGYCYYGEGPNGEAPITLTVEDTVPGPLFRGAKLVGIIIQLGLVSIFLRFTVDPVLDTYNYIRAKLG